ncbi:hypothetical protein [Bacillus infantis]|uniref:hypothetical protein n=1 Tax=Bacillus infantis TaxID=324767 RepID=UPI003CF5DBF9
MKELKNTVLMIISTIAMFYILGFVWLEIYTSTTIMMFGASLIWWTLMCAANPIGGEIDDVH